MAARDEPAEDEETAGDASAFMLLASATALLRFELMPFAFLGVTPANAVGAAEAAAGLVAGCGEVALPIDAGAEGMAATTDLVRDTVGRFISSDSALPAFSGDVVDVAAAAAPSAANDTLGLPDDMAQLIYLEAEGSNETRRGARETME